MAKKDRLVKTLSIINERDFVSVRELSKILDVSEVTIRRDLQELEDEHLIKRAFGGALPLNAGSASSNVEQTREATSSYGIMTENTDVLIAASVSPYFEKILMGKARRANIPIIAESSHIDGMNTLVAVDNYKASYELGCWVGRYAKEHFSGRANILEFTYHLNNTRERSQGFMQGLREIIPDCQRVLSFSAEFSSYQLTTDALHVHPHINIIFAINDKEAFGAIQACRDMKVKPGSVIVLPFGLGDDRVINELMSAEFCKAGIAMFPEIVAPVCIAAAIRAYNNQLLDEFLITPHALVTPQTLPQFYRQQKTGWQINWETIHAKLRLPLDIRRGKSQKLHSFPKHITFIEPFSTLEWYKKLTRNMKSYANDFHITLDIVDEDTGMRNELSVCKRRIAQQAAEHVNSGDVLFMNTGEIALFLAEELKQKKDITVITNSIPVFDMLAGNSTITLISTGGELSLPDNILIGSVAENSLRDIHADTFFLDVAGISLDLDLFYSSYPGASMEKAMLDSSNNIIVLADHTKFNYKAGVTLSSLQSVTKIITDDNLLASIRLELTKRGIQILVT